MLLVGGDNGVDRETVLAASDPGLTGTHGTGPETPPGRGETGVSAARETGPPQEFARP